METHFLRSRKSRTGRGAGRAGATGCAETHAGDETRMFLGDRLDGTAALNIPPSRPTLGQIPQP